MTSSTSEKTDSATEATAPRGQVPKAKSSPRPHKRKVSNAEHLAQYAALRATVGVLNMMPIDEALIQARQIGLPIIQSPIFKRHRERAKENIQRSLPHLKRDEIRSMIDRIFEHVAMLGVEFALSPRYMNVDASMKYVTAQNMEEPLHLLMRDEPTFMLTGHFGNWELLGSWLASIGIDMEALARPIDNPYIDGWVRDIREKRGLRILTKWDASDRILKLIEENRRVSFIADQNAGDRGTFVPFFNRLASAYKSIGLLAIQFNVPIICGYARRIGHRFQYEVGTVDIIYPDDWVDQPDPLFYLTARYQLALQKMIMIAPEQYIWFHRRWRSRPRHERQGKEMPKGLRRKLETLPWMTEELMRDLQQPVPYTRHR